MSRFFITIIQRNVAFSDDDDVFSSARQTYNPIMTNMYMCVSQDTKEIFVLLKTYQMCYLLNGKCNIQLIDRISQMILIIFANSQVSD
jgi:hypothetical protein